jgi:RNA polymerase sigma-70 factor (ECF subfamily)
LPDAERAVADLLFYQGLSQEEAAALLGVDVRTVQRRWQRVRVHLHGRLGGEGPNG